MIVPEAGGTTSVLKMLVAAATAVALAIQGIQIVISGKFPAYLHVAVPWAPQPLRNRIAVRLLGASCVLAAGSVLGVITNELALAVRIPPPLAAATVLLALFITVVALVIEKSS
jgi:hypothetical protein